MIYFCVYVCAYVRVLASDRLHNIRPWWWDKMDIQMTPPKHRSIDERMIKYKGRYFARQYMPNKHVRRGLKVYNSIGIRIEQHFLPQHFQISVFIFFPHINHVHLSICVLKNIYLCLCPEIRTRIAPFGVHLCHLEQQSLRNSAGIA